MSFDQIKTNMQVALTKAEDALKKEFSGLRTGRASTGLLDGILVDAYGSTSPLNQVGNVSVPEPRMLSVTVWDKGLLKAVEKAIVEAGLGLNPMNDGVMIRIPIPPLSEERRIELVKIAGRYTEESKVSARNARRDALDAVKALKAANAISEDDEKRHEKEIQEMTDKAVEAMDAHFKVKEVEIKQV